MLKLRRRLVTIVFVAYGAFSVSKQAYQFNNNNNNQGTYTPMIYDLTSYKLH